MMAVPAMLAISALRKLLVFLINHNRYAPTAAKTYNCDDAIITVLELDIGLGPAKSIEQFCSV